VQTGVYLYKPFIAVASTLYTDIRQVISALDLHNSVVESVSPKKAIPLLAKTHYYKDLNTALIFMFMELLPASISFPLESSCSHSNEIWFNIKYIL
jgi:hypothetical protein